VKFVHSREKQISQLYAQPAMAMCESHAEKLLMTSMNVLLFQTSARTVVASTLTAHSDVNASRGFPWTPPPHNAETQMSV
jgi:hypothetical protein